MNGITLMMAKSMVLYVAAVLVQRTWTRLNADVTHVIRRSQEPLGPTHAADTEATRDCCWRESRGIAAPWRSCGRRPEAVHRSLGVLPARQATNGSTHERSPSRHEPTTRSAPAAPIAVGTMKATRSCHRVARPRIPQRNTYSTSPDTTTKNAVCSTCSSMTKTLACTDRPVRVIVRAEFDFAGPLT